MSYGRSQSGETHNTIDGARTLAHGINVAANVDSIMSAPPGKRWRHVVRTVVIAGAVEGLTLLFKAITRDR